MSWLRRNLLRKLLLSYLLPVGLGIALMGIWLSSYLDHYIHERTGQEMMKQAKSINLSLQENPGIDLKSLLQFFETGYDKRITLFDTEGKVIAASYSDEVYQAKALHPQTLSRILNGETLQFYEKSKTDKQLVLYTVIPWGSDDNILGAIELSMPKSALAFFSHQLREITLWTALSGLLLSMTLGTLLYWSISKPLKKLEMTATELAVGHTDSRFQTDTQDEFGHLADALNLVAEKMSQMQQERITMEQRRDDLLANISHEFRTPLTGIQGYLEALQDGLITDDQARLKCYQIIYKEAMHMNHLVDNLMDLIKLKDGKVQLSLYYVQLNDLFEKVKLTQMKKLESKGNRLIIDCPPDLPQIMADAVRLEQVFHNLIDNANKFTSRGEIRLEAQARAQEVWITIRDTGIGIPSHDLNRIWERFFKAHKTEGQSNERGAGLGLAIVKEIIELHQGVISVSSELGKGTEFKIRLPIHGPGQS